MSFCTLSSIEIESPSIYNDILRRFIAVLLDRIILDVITERRRGIL